MEEEEESHYNNRLFVEPHLVRAQIVYKDIRICSFHPTHPQTHTCTHPDTHMPHHTHPTNTCITGDQLVQIMVIYHDSLETEVSSSGDVFPRNYLVQQLVGDSYPQMKLIRDNPLVRNERQEICFAVPFLC